MKQSAIEFRPVARRPPCLVKGSQPVSVPIVEYPLQARIFFVALRFLPFENIDHVAVNGEHPVPFIFCVLGMNSDLSVPQINVLPAQGHYFAEPASSVIRDHQGELEIWREFGL